ncbi:mandelate racemase/muconate lactonizing enzyme family protein [uncultured Alsobacter sp.]|uniref:mandelate racemase/muconate lactonizing enzyme family protein n=1 Tax=uncultured Alsobacter sp. TaxID=1748258 RepID=UPI0025F75D75|nr:mandelate racemase/muconate lactonizing enzyme family protein [uncultured Alsobacter sp.]
MGEKSGLKIRAVESFPVWIGHRNQMLVKITADDGTFGWGEAGLSGRELAVAGAIDHYRELLIGEDPFRIAHIWQKLYRSQYFEGGRVLTAAQSAIDIALYDLKGKALGLPAYELMGGRVRDKIPSLATTNAIDTKTAVEQAKAYVADGFDVVRFGRVNPLMRDEGETLFEPRQSLVATADCLIAAREALGRGVTIGVDLHHRMSVAETITFCQRMPRGTLDFLEEPIRDESPEAYETLRKCVDVPFAIGEEFSSKWQAQPFVERGLTQYMRLDVCNIGGFTEALKVAGWCETHYVDLFPHNPLGPVCTAASIHFAAVVPNFAWLEYNQSRFRPASPIEKEIFLTAPKLEGTFFPISHAPGIGIEINEEVLKRDAFRHWNPPMLSRHDGSHTNW